MKPVLRDWLSTMEKEGMLKHVTQQVSTEYELAAVGKKLEHDYCVMFENVEGSDIPVVTGLTPNRESMAKSMNMTYPELLEKFNEALNTLTPCEVLDKSAGPFAIKENIFIGEEVDLEKLMPICTHHEKDKGKYLTAAVCIAKDPETGVRNLAIHRHMVSGKNRLGALLLPRHTFQMYAKAEAMGKPLEIALVIGMHPSLLLASQATTRYGIDEFEIAGSLLGEPVQLVKCETVDIEVPVECEFVIEGKLLPGVRENEGPFGEYPRTYGPEAPRHVIEVTAVTYRNKPIYHTIVPATMEHLLLGGVSREATMMQVIKQTSSNVKKVHLTAGSGCRYHAVVQLDQKHGGEAKNVIFAALTSSTEVKHVTVVNPDIDIFDMQDVEWAIANRVQAARDVFIVPDAMGNQLDPSSRAGVSDKMGIDATIPMGGDMARYEKIRIPGIDTLDISKYL